MSKYAGVVNISCDNDYSVVSDWTLQGVDVVKTYNGNSIDTLVDRLRILSNKSNAVYVHDLSYIGLTLIDWLLHNGYNWVSSNYDFEPHTFTTMLNQLEVYAITICYDSRISRETKHNKTITIINSSNFFPPTLSDAKKYTHTTTDIDTLVYILNMLQHYGLLSSRSGYNVTLAQASLKHFKAFIGANSFNYYFPPLDWNTHNEIADAYYGGFVYLNKDCINKEVTHGYVLDNNGLYADVMSNCMLPYGTPVRFEGNYYDKQNRKYHKDYPLFIQYIKGDFILKDNALPVIPTHETIEHPNEPKYITQTHNTKLFLSCVDLKWLYRNYYNNGIDFFDDDDYGMKYCGGFMFKASDKILKPWVDYWCKERVDADINNDVCRRKLCKMVINALSGKFAANSSYAILKPVIDDQTDLLEFVEVAVPMRDRRRGGSYVINEETGEILTSSKSRANTVYIPMSVFITAYGRNKTIGVAQKIQYDTISQYGASRYVYSDTDSVHFELSDIPTYIKTDPHKIGDWKVECEFERGKYLGIKTYMLERDDKTTKLVCAGLPRDSWGNVTYSNFTSGQTYTATQKIIIHGGAGMGKVAYTLSNNKTLEALRHKRI